MWGESDKRSKGRIVRCGLVLTASALGAACAAISDDDVASAEICNGIDDDGDGAIDEGFPDVDGDSVADCIDGSCPVVEVTSPTVLCDGVDLPVESLWELEVEERFLLDDRFGEVWPMGPVLFVPESGPRGAAIYVRAYSEPTQAPSGTRSTWLLDATGAPYLAIERFTWPQLVVEAGSEAPRLFGQEIGDSQSWFEEFEVPSGNTSWISPPVPFSLFPSHLMALHRPEPGMLRLLSGFSLIEAAGPAVVQTLPVDTHTPIPAVYDLDGDGDEEIAVGGWVFDTDGTPLFATPSGHGSVYVPYFDEQTDGPMLLAAGLDHLMWFSGDGLLDAQVEWDPGGPLRPPCMADFDGDGLPELGWAAGTVGPGTGGLGVVDLDSGQPLWSEPSEIGVGGCAGFDFNGDGRFELVVEEQERLGIYDGSTGALLMEHPLRQGLIISSPTILDVDGDGSAEILVTSQGDESTRGVWILGHPRDAWMPGAKDSWPGQQYHPDDYVEGGVIAPNPRLPSAETNFLRAMPPGDKALPNLVPVLEACATGCGDTNELMLQVRVRNTGTADAAGEVALQLLDGAGGVLLDLQMTVDLPPGETSDATALTAPLAALDGGGLTLRIDATQGGEPFIECARADNELRWGQDLCGGTAP